VISDVDRTSLENFHMPTAAKDCENHRLQLVDVSFLPTGQRRLSSNVELSSSLARLSPREGTREANSKESPRNP